MSESTISQVCAKASAADDGVMTPEESNAELAGLLARRTRADKSMTAPQAKYLTWLVISLYPEWDEAQVWNAISGTVAAHSNKDAGTVTLAVLAFAANATNATPGGMRAPGRHWDKAQALSSPAAA